MKRASAVLLLVTSAGCLDLDEARVFAPERLAPELQVVVQARAGQELLVFRRGLDESIDWYERNL